MRKTILKSKQGRIRNWRNEDAASLQEWRHHRKWAKLFELAIIYLELSVPTPVLSNIKKVVSPFCISFIQIYKKHMKKIIKVNLTY